MKGGIATAASLGFVLSICAVLLYRYNNDLNLVLMRLFRDLSRYKSRKRLYGNTAALMPILMGQEEPLPIELASGKDQPGDDGFTMTLEQLAEMDGRTETTPIYLSIKGHIYDVSAGRDMYGPGAGYHVLVAKDATSLFAYGCAEEACVPHVPQHLPDDSPLQSEADKWLELYHYHDKYKYVGELVRNVVDDVLSDGSNTSPRPSQTDS